MISYGGTLVNPEGRSIAYAYVVRIFPLLMIFFERMHKFAVVEAQQFRLEYDRQSRIAGAGLR
jgi:hypothetical protein